MDLDRLITETLRRKLLVENAINNSWRAARKMVIAKFGCAYDEAEKMLDGICNQVGLSYEMVKFIKGCTRMYLNGEFKDQRVLGDFKDALNKIKTDGHIGEFDSNLRRLDQPEGAVNSAQDIINIFKPKIDQERAEQRQKLSGMEFEQNTDYEIVKINSFEEASEYSDYTSWCVTSNEDNYDGYTNNGINQFYFCLQNGFENIEDNGNFNDKTDEYALSMLAILVNPEGELIHCTNRKNNDQSTLNPMEISELLGCHFYETFKPNTTWRDTLEDAKNKLANGESPKSVFEDVEEINNGLFLVSLLDRWNLLKGSSFINEHWYECVGEFREGFAAVNNKAKGWNFINRDGKEFFDCWYDNVCDFSEGFAVVKDENKGWNFINRDGKEICNRWYDNAGSFSEGFAWVWDKTKGWNFINHDGKEICDRWYDDVCSFREGFAMVQDFDKGWNFINRDGKEVFDCWYNDVCNFSEGFAAVKDETKGWNFINHDGEELCDRWYDNVFDFFEGFAKVYDRTKGYNFINSDGKEICDRWYDNGLYFSEGFAMVIVKNKGRNFINRDGNEIGDRWYDSALSFSEGFAKVEYKGKLYWLRKDGVLCGYETKEPIEDGAEQLVNDMDNKNMLEMKDKKMRVFVITEECAQKFADECKMTPYKFVNCTKTFLNGLIADPVNTKLPEILSLHGFERNGFIKKLIELEILKRFSKIKNVDNVDKFVINYNVPIKNFGEKVKRLYVDLFNENIELGGEMIREEGCCGGATGCSTVGGDSGFGFVQPLTLGRQPKKKKKKKRL